MSRHISLYLYARLTQYLVSGLNLSFLYWSPDWSINSGLLGLRLLDQIQSMAEYWFLTSKIMHWKGRIYLNFFFFFVFSDSSNQEAAFPQGGGRVLAWGKRETTTGFSSCKESHSPRLCHMYAGQQNTAPKVNFHVYQHWRKMISFISCSCSSGWANINISCSLLSWLIGLGILK